ncbi:MAG: DUF5131 family protein [Eubacteriales bacterium]|nr:DUF5131 family protein [Eubacteriales bacterium]
MAIWDPWRGCHRKSEGCENCYLFQAAERKGETFDVVSRSEDFDRLTRRDAKGNACIKPGQMVYLCFRSDFLLPEADAWRAQAWEMIRSRPDLDFLFLTKRIERFGVALPADYPAGLEHVTVAVSVENQRRADERLPVFKALPIVHKLITVQPMLERVDLSAYLDEDIEGVVVGGESGKDVRPLHDDWVTDLRRQCLQADVPFTFRQVGSRFVQDGVERKVARQYLCAEARKTKIDTKKLYHIKTERLVIRKLRLSDLDTLVSYRSDPACARYQRGTKTDAQALAGLITAHEASRLEQGETRLGIADGHSNSLLGDIYLAMREKTITLGITLSPAAWGKGLAREALGAVIPVLRQNYPGYELAALIEPENAASIRLFTALGFAFTEYAEKLRSQVYVLAGDAQ